MIDVFVGARGAASTRRAAAVLREAASSVHLNRKTTTGVVVGVMAFGAAGAGALFTPITQVSKVVVEEIPDAGRESGVGPLEASQQQMITAAAGVEMSEPLVQVDLETIEQRVAALGRYRRVEVSRQWPGSVRIEVLPRVAVLAVAPKGEGDPARVELVDESGIAYEKVAEAPPGLPVAQLADIRDIAQRQAAVAAVAAFNVQRRAQLAGLEVSSDAQVTMSLDGVRVNWGGIGEGPLKAAVVAALVERSGIRTLDVRAPQRPVSTS